MIFQYVYLDYGATNLLTKIKYSIVNLREAIRNSGENHEIHLYYVRSLARNPAYDLNSLKTGKYIDVVKESVFKSDEINIQPGWYHRIFAPYLDQFRVNKKPTLYLDGNISFHKIVPLDENAIYFWEKDNVWHDVPWGFAKTQDALDFLKHCKAERLADGPIERYSMFNGNIVFFPVKYADEAFDKYRKMIDWIVNKYQPDYNWCNCICSCAAQIAMSIIAQDLAQRDDLSIKFAFREFPSHVLTRFVSESESDIAGSMRLLFDA